jgi:hypothetical protein
MSGTAPFDGSLTWPASFTVGESPSYSTFYALPTCPPNAVPGISGCVRSGGCEGLPPVFNVPLVPYSNNGSAAVVGLDSALRLASERYPHHQAGGRLLA